MLVLDRLIGILILALGVLFTVRPQWMNKTIDFFGQGKRLYINGALRLVLGGIFLLSAPQCRLPGAAFFIGVLFILGGALIFVLGTEKTKSIIDHWKDLPAMAARLLALITVTFGAFILYAV